MTFKSKKDYLFFLRNRPVSLEKSVYWSGEYLDKQLGKEYEIIRTRMPLQDNAKYLEWKIHFERFIPFLRNNIILIGVSLGGIFLAKYLSEHEFPRKIRAVFLVGAPFDNSIKGEDLVGGFKLITDLTLLERSTQNLHLVFSVDDEVVPVQHAEKFRKRLVTAQLSILKGKNGHFRIAQFPEMVKMIRCLKKSR